MQKAQSGDTQDVKRLWFNTFLQVVSSDAGLRTARELFDGAERIDGIEISPGVWRNDDSSGGCYWERVSGWSGALGDIISNSFSSSIQTVTIEGSDVGFFSEDCGTWTKIG